MKYARGVQITPHFNSTEFMCKCGCGQIDVDVRLVERLEILRNILGCPIYVNSGYRCRQHDINVGGSGTGTHTYGRAVDIHTDCYNAKEISEYANFLGFGGIAFITNNDIHLDNRDEGGYYDSNGNELKKWHGDERTNKDININNLILVKG